MADGDDRRATLTRLLEEYARGRPEAFDRLVPLLYSELEAIAHRQMRGERDDHTWSTRELVHEAYVRLSRLERFPWQSRAHFLAVAGRVMQRLLIDHARAHAARKRGGAARRVPLDAVPLVTEAQAEQLVALDEALEGLDRLGPRCRAVVEHRVFAGMTCAESADVLGVSPATVRRDWVVARAWLNYALGPVGWHDPRAGPVRGPA